MGKVRDLTGQRFGRLTVLEQGKDKHRPNGKRVVTWECVCDCGNKTNVSAGHLTSGHTWSCGCAHKEQMEAWKTFKLTHGRAKGKTKDRAYRTWMFIKRRCYNKNDVCYPHYGAKGITMWSGWVNNPSAFCDYVSSLDRYDEPSVTIDRIDFKKGYEPGNLRWITLDEQQRNKSSNVFLTINGETHTISEWARITGMNASTISFRVRNGWDAENAVFSPANQGIKYKSRISQNKLPADHINEFT